MVFISGLEKIATTLLCYQLSLSLPELCLWQLAHPACNPGHKQKLESNVSSSLLVVVAEGEGVANNYY